MPLAPSPSPIHSHTSVYREEKEERKEKQRRRGEEEEGREEEEKVSSLLFFLGAFHFLVISLDGFRLCISGVSKRC